METITKSRPIGHRDVGNVKWSAYWHRFSLIAEFDGELVTEVDDFDSDAPSVRRHSTVLTRGDKLMTLEEYYDQLEG